MRTEAINQALKKTISADRLEKYLEAVDGNLDAAIGLYERNTTLSEAFYAPLQAVEVCLRNALHDQMTERYGSSWFTSGAAPLNNEARRMVDDAYRDLQHEPVPIPDGKVVAELKFAFWVSLIGPTYDASLWRQALHKAFLIGGGKPRSTVHGRFNAIRRFRNRVAHHEPILSRPLDSVHAEIMQAIGWMV